MKLSYAADTDDRLILTAAEEGEGEVKIRVQPTIYRANGQYQGWGGVSWTLTCTADEALQVREAMRAMFAVLGQRGVEAGTGALTALVAELKEDGLC